MRVAIRAGLAAVAAAGVLGGGLTAVASPATPGPAVRAQAAAKKPKPKTVGIFDNYYAPAKLTIRPRTKVTWTWPIDVGDSHDIKTSKVPKGAKKFASPPFAAEAQWSRTFTKPGTYKLYCTFHETEMTMTITVKKK